MIHTLADQIREVERELVQRGRVYPQWVDSKRMTQATADRQMGRLRSALATLQACQAGNPPGPDLPSPQGALI